VTRPVRNDRSAEDLPFDPDGPEADLTPALALRRVARREHTLLSIMELSHELTVSLDLYAIADLALYNLMGAVGTPKSALWIRNDREPEAPLVMLRAHGIRKSGARQIGRACGRDILKILDEEEKAMLLSTMEGEIGPAAAASIGDAGIALFSPVINRGKLLGMIGLGHRISGEPYSTMDLQVLNASAGLLGVAMDNTGMYNRLLESHRQVKAANERLQELDRLKTEFLSNINHELRTPLTIIMAYMEILLRQGLADERQTEFLKTMDAEANKLRLLLERLLSFSDVSQNRIEAHVQVGDIAGLVTEFHQERLPGVAQGLREFSLTIEGPIPPTRYNRHVVTEILDALIDNAVKFTQPGAHLALRVRPIDADGEALVAVQVEDDGPGIAPDSLPHLFESFRQGDGSHTRKVGGMGIGLSHAAKMTEAMGGRLTVQSDLGSGTRFTLLLPVADSVRGARPTDV
jgi:signal transduction histidine kinase